MHGNVLGPLYDWRTFCSSINDLPRSDMLHRALSRDPKIDLGTLFALPVDVCSPRGNIRALANYILSQFGGYTRVSGSCNCPPGQTFGLEVGCEDGHLQKGRMGYRFFCPV
jgi:hypothetical protein